MDLMAVLGDLIDMARRRARLLAIVVAAGCVFSALFALSQPRIYQSTEVIRLAAPSADDLQMIELHLTTRGTLVEVINAYTLYGDLPDFSADQMMMRLRQAVLFQWHGAVQNGRTGDNSPSFLSISAQMTNPMQARQVAHDFGQRAVRLSREARLGQAQSRVAVLTMQESRLRAEITTLQGEAADLRARYDVAAGDDMGLRHADIARPNAGLLAIEQDRLMIVREAEQTLDAYARRQQQMAAEIDAISARKTEAIIGLEMVGKTLMDRVVVIDPATQPEMPISGSRMRIALIGMGLSVLLAFALAYGAERANPVIRTPRQMLRRVGYAPIVAIPYLDPVPPKVTRWQRFLTWLNGPEPSDGSTA